jgi:hypothetical protein
MAAAQRGRSAGRHARVLLCAAVVHTLLWVPPSLTLPTDAPASPSAWPGASAAFAACGVQRGLRQDVARERCGCHGSALRGPASLSPPRRSRLPPQLAAPRSEAGRLEAAALLRAHGLRLRLRGETAASAAFVDDRAPRTCAAVPGSRCRPSACRAHLAMRSYRDGGEDAPSSGKARYGNEYKIPLDDAAPRGGDDEDTPSGAAQEPLVYTWDGDLMPSRRVGIYSDNEEGVLILKSTLYGGVAE